MSDRNPKWTWDEVILLLDLYFQIGPTCVAESHPEVIALSSLLRNSGFHPKVADPESFRNPTGISMKLANLLSLDNAYSGTGLDGASALDRLAWGQFSTNRGDCHSMAEAIRSHLVQGKLLPTSDLPSFEEGGVLLVVHRRHERNRQLVELKKRKAIESGGGLICEACRFSFCDNYGSRGVGFIECHHTVPLSTLSATLRTRIEDLSLVCANCHRMLHRDPFWSIERLREAVHLSHSNPLPKNSGP